MSNKTFFGFAIADAMFGNDNAVVTRRVLSVEAAKAAIAEAQASGTLVSALNPSHVPTIDAMRTRYGINVEVPEVSPRITITPGDRVIVMSIRGLGRLEGRTQYTADEVAAATFSFSVWTRTE